MYGGTFASSEDLKENYKNLSRSYESSISTRREDRSKSIKEQRQESFIKARGIFDPTPDMFLYLYKFQVNIDNILISLISNINNGYIRFRSLAYLYLNTLEIINSYIPNLCFNVQFNMDSILTEEEMGDTIYNYNKLFINNINLYIEALKEYIKLLIPKIYRINKNIILKKYNNIENETIKEEANEVFGDEDLISELYKITIDLDNLDKFNKAYEYAVKPGNFKYFEENKLLSYTHDILTEITASDLVNNSQVTHNFCTISIEYYCNNTTNTIISNYYPDVSDIVAFKESLPDQVNAFEKRLTDKVNAFQSVYNYITNNNIGISSYIL